MHFPGCRSVVDNISGLMVAMVLLVVTCSAASIVQPNRPAMFLVTEADTAAKHRPVRDDSLADLLLKNLRFRDVEKRVPNAQAAEIAEKFVKLQGNKRGSVSVAELAAMFSQLKAGRGQATDDGVKLHSLRFGGYE